MKANLITKNIELTKAEAKKAGKINSAEFAELNALREAFPGFEVVVKTAATTKRKSEYKGLTYEFMEKYIVSHDKEGVIMSEFLLLRAKSEEAEVMGIDSMGYMEIKTWFLKTYPAIATYCHMFRC